MKAYLPKPDKKHLSVKSPTYIVTPKANIRS